LGFIELRGRVPCLAAHTCWVQIREFPFPLPPPQIIKDIECDLNKITENIIIINMIIQRTFLDLVSNEEEHGCFQECLLRHNIVMYSSLYNKIMI